MEQFNGKVNSQKLNDLRNNNELVYAKLAWASRKLSNNQSWNQTRAKYPYPRV